MRALTAAAGVEPAHAGHVAALCSQLFAALRGEFRLPAADLRLLEAAARLHDIGYAVDADRHAERGAWRVVRDGLAGFAAGERCAVAAAILLHNAPRPWVIRPPFALSAPLHRRALRLAAILRVADALDHGHIQDARLRSVSLTGRRAELAVRFGFEPDNALRAERRADLWNRVFPRHLHVRVLAPRRKGHFGDLLHPGSSAVEAARRILSLQHDAMAQHLAGMRRSADPVHLHDFRVALRRFRAALRLFRPSLAGGTRARDLEVSLAALSDALGPVRDFQSWLSFVRSRETLDACRRVPGWRRYTARLAAENARQWRTLGSLLDEWKVADRLRGMDGFLRVEIPLHARRTPSEPAAGLLARRLRRRLKRLCLRCRPGHADSPDELHELRKRIRRARYATEFAAGVLGRRVGKLAERLKDAADDLGAVHDADVRLAQPAVAGVRTPSALRALMARRRAAHLGRFKRRTAPALRKMLRKTLADGLDRRA